MDESSSLGISTEEQPVAAIRLRKTARNPLGANLGLDIGKKYPKIPFTVGNKISPRDVTEKSGIVRKEGNGKLFKRVFFLATLFGNVTVTIPSGQTVQGFLSSKTSFDFHIARHIIVLTMEKRPWVPWWSAVSGRVISLNETGTLVAYLKDLPDVLQTEQ